MQRLSEPGRALPLLLASAAGISALLALRGLPLPDEGAILTQAARILHGGVFYRDLDAYSFPATSYALALAMAIFGEHFTVARALAALLYCTSFACLYAAALVVTGPRRAAVFGLTLLAWKPIAWPAFTMLLYSEFAFMWGCAAVALLLRGALAGSAPRLVLAGACVGLTVVSKQSLGIYLGGATLGLLLAPTLLTGAPAPPPKARLRSALLLAGGAALPVLPFAGWFAAQGLLPNLIQSGLLRPFTDYLPTSGLSMLPPLAWWRPGALSPFLYLPTFPTHLFEMSAGRAGVLLVEGLARAMYTSVVVSFAWALVVRLRPGSPGDGRAKVLSLAVLAVPFVLSAWPRVDFYHVSSIYPVPALLLFALASRRARRTGRRHLGLATTGLTFAMGLAAWVTAFQVWHYSIRVELDRADLWLSAGNLWMPATVERIREEVPPGFPLFVYGHEAYFYFLCDRYFPWPFAQLYPGMTGSDDGATLARRLAAANPLLVVRGYQAIPGLPRIASYAPHVARLVSRRYGPDAQLHMRLRRAGPARLVLLRRQSES